MIVNGETRSSDTCWSAIIWKNAVRLGPHDRSNNFYDKTSYSYLSPSSNGFCTEVLVRLYV